MDRINSTATPVLRPPSSPALPECRRTRDTVVRQARRILSPVGATVLAAAAVVAALAWAAQSRGIEFSELSRDPAEVLGTPVHIGFLSSLGILIWWSSAAICFFAANLHGRDGGLRPFLLTSACIAAWLALDDFFLLHDVVLPGYVGIRQRYVLAAYLVGMLFYFGWFHRRIRETEYLVLAAALCFFGASLLADAIQDRRAIPGQHVIEDGAKFLGICLWTLYFWRTARAVRRLEPAAGGL